MRRLSKGTGKSRYGIFNSTFFLSRQKAVGMAVRAVACSSCRMWEIRETSSVPGGYSCEKGTWLQLLTNRIRELELELDALRIIRGAESIVDKSYSEVVTLNVQAAGSWVTTRREFLEEVTKRMDEDRAVDVVYVDFSKAFDKVPQSRMVMKDRSHGIQ
eukprot:g42228.t1